MSMTLFISSLLLLTPGVARAAALAYPSPDSLLQGWKDAIYTEHEASTFKMKLIEPGGEAVERQAQVWFKTAGAGRSRLSMRFQEPVAMRGVGFLSLRENSSVSDQWLYFPAYRKARRLSSRSRDEAFLDSDFNNGDISFDHERSFEFRVTGTKSWLGQEVYVLEGKSKDQADSENPYSREVLLIRKSDRLNVRTEFYGKEGSLEKILTVHKWKRYGNRWAADAVEVENNRTHHRTTFEFVARDTSHPPADRIFTLQELERGK